MYRSRYISINQIMTHFIIATPIYTLMTDNNNGNYTYSYTVQNDGILSIGVRLLNRNYFYQKCYGTTDLSGATTYSSTASSNWDYSYGYGSICAGYSNYMSMTLETFLRAPITGSLSIRLQSDDGSTLRVGTVCSFLFDFILP